MEEKEIVVKRKNRVLIVIMAISIILLITSIYMLFIRKDDDINSDSNNNDNVVEKERVYKSSDGKFTLRIVDKNDEKAKQDLIKHFEEVCEENDCYLSAKESVEDLQDDIKYYAYFNDIALFIEKDIHEDEHYVAYSLAGYDNTAGWGYKLIVNKDTNIIEIKPEDLANKESDCMKSSFCGFMWSPSFVKTDLGYFFIDGYNEELYTTDWKKLGYVKLNHNEDDSYELKEIDSNGVTVYKEINFLECGGDAYPGNCQTEYLNPVKYDVNGNVVTD